MDYLASEEVVTHVKHLAGCAEYPPPLPVEVDIGKSTYSAAKYMNTITDNNQPSPALYIVGKLPASYRRDKRTRYEHAGRLWYIVYYADEATVNDPRFSKYHPLGVHFVMFRYPNNSEPGMPVMKMKITELQDEC